MDIFSVPIGDKVLIYAPLHEIAALVNPAAARLIRTGLFSSTPVSPAVQGLVNELKRPVKPPQPHTGSLCNPFFLGLIPTRGCNMACRYCDFAAPDITVSTMDLTTARNAVDAYFDVLETDRAEVHFFGGEPFYADQVVHFVVGYAAQRAAESGRLVRFEATTNGLYSGARAEWIAEHFDTVVLSLDGPPEIQNAHRPTRNGKNSSEIVTRSARIFSEGSVELVIRVAVTDQTARRMPEIAYWVSQEFRPSTVCFESLTLSPLAQAAGMRPPDPWEFAGGMVCAERVLESYGIETVFSTADFRANRLSSCPVGKDALIVAPDGAVDACYLLPEDWASSGINMRIGRLAGAQFNIDADALLGVRELTVDHRPLCADCICRYHCAGGCHVNHDTSGVPGQYDDLCVQTRVVTIAKLLRKIGQHQLVDLWMANRAWQETVVFRPTDRL